MNKPAKPRSKKKPAGKDDKSIFSELLGKKPGKVTAADRKKAAKWDAENDTITQEAFEDAATSILLSNPPNQPKDEHTMPSIKDQKTEHKLIKKGGKWVVKTYPDKSSTNGKK